MRLGENDKAYLEWLTKKICQDNIDKNVIDGLALILEKCEAICNNRLNTVGKEGPKEGPSDR